jgi:hypothetical protein
MGVKVPLLLVLDGFSSLHYIKIWCVDLQWHLRTELFALNPF